VLGKTAQELRTFECHLFFAALVGVVLVVEGDPMAAVDAADTLIGDSNLVRVTPQVFDYLLRSAERLFGEHHPAHAIQLFQQRLHVFVRFNL